jgi:hypothetical protein
MASKFIIQLMKKGAQALSGQGKTTGTEVIKSIKPDVGKLDKIQKGKKRITDITDKYAVGFAKDNPKLLKKFRKNSKKNLDSISKIYKGKKDGGRMGLKKGGGSDLGMQSVKHGIDKNPNITAADPKAKFIAKAKNKKSKKKII